MGTQIPATKVIFELKDGRRIEGPPDDVIVMSHDLTGGKWTGYLTMLKSIYDEHAKELPIGSIHTIKFWTGDNYSGSGEIQIDDCREGVNALAQPNIDLIFTGISDPDLMA